MNSIEEAKKRVDIRVASGGHFVPENEIQNRFIQGYANLNQHFRFIDQVHVYNTSAYKLPPSYCFSVSGGLVDGLEDVPEFLTELTPDIISLLNRGAG